MATHNTSEQRLAQAFRLMNQYLMIPMWRLGLGWVFKLWPQGIGQIMVIVHTGRRTGLRRATPVNYALVNGDVYCLSGFGTTSDWYHNLMANPQVEVWLPDGWWAGTAEDVSDAPKRLRLLRKVLIASGFAAPLFGGIDPATISDAELAEATASYRLIRIRREEARTGPGGPGEYAWVWPVLAMALGLLLLLRPRKQR